MQKMQKITKMAPRDVPGSKRHPKGNQKASKRHPKGIQKNPKDIKINTNLTPLESKF